MRNIAFVILGLLFLMMGLAHLCPGIDLWDKRTFLTFHRFLSRKPLIGLFRALWPLGTTPAALALLGSTLILGMRPFLLAVLVYILANSIERTIKKTIRRPRPFTAIPDVIMLQPRQPSDPSFPSGDILRVWFLAITVPFSFELHWTWFLLAFLLAFIIMLGRIAMGVHYPLDAVSGAGLGILFAGIYLILFP